MVDDFGIKYVGSEHFTYLINTIKKYYPPVVDEKGEMYCGITLKWSYAKNNRYLDISMPKYIPKKLIEFNHPKPDKPQHCPYPPPVQTYGKEAQNTKPPDKSPMAPKDKAALILKIISSLLYYGRAVDITILKALNSLSAEQSKPTINTYKKCRHLLDYCATYPNATIRYYPSEMILQIHSDASYLNESKARSTAGGHYFLLK